MENTHNESKDDVSSVHCIELKGTQKNTKNAKMKKEIFCGTKLFKEFRHNKPISEEIFKIFQPPTCSWQVDLLPSCYVIKLKEHYTLAQRNPCFTGIFFFASLDSLTSLFLTAKTGLVFFDLWFAVSRFLFPDRLDGKLRAGNPCGKYGVWVKDPCILWLRPGKVGVWVENTGSRFFVQSIKSLRKEVQILLV